MVMSQILKLVNFTKTQKSRYLENETLFFLQIQNFISYTSRAALWQKTLVAEVTFKVSYILNKIGFNLLLYHQNCVHLVTLFVSH